MGYAYPQYVKAITGGIELSNGSGTPLLNITEGTDSVLIRNSSTTTTDELVIYPNSTDTYPNIRLIGDGSSIHRIPTGESWFINEVTTQILSVSYASNKTTLEGGAIAGDDLEIFPNTSDTDVGFILYGGTGTMEIRCPDIYLEQSGGTDYGNIYWSGSYGFTFYPCIANADLTLRANGSGNIRFGVYAGITTETNAGYITIKDFAGNTRKLCVVA